MRGGSWQGQRRARRPLLCAVLCGSCLGGVGPSSLVAGAVAHAAGEDPIARQVERLAADANAAYKVYDFQRATELLERAYQLRQVPALLYNLAKAYDRLGDQDKAIELYRRYADSGDADPKLRARAEARIQQYEESRPRKDPRPEPVDPRPRIDPRPSVGVTPRVPTEDEGVRRLREWKTRRARARVDGVVLASVAGGLALVGAGLSVSAFLLHGRYRDSIGLEVDRRHDRDSARAQAISADVLYGVAAITASVGIYYLWRGYHREQPPAARAWTPIVAPLITRDGAGLVVGGGF